MRILQKMRVHLCDKDGNPVHTEGEQNHPLSQEGMDQSKAEGKSVNLFGSLYLTGCSIPPVLAYPMKSYKGNRDGELCHLTPDPFTSILKHFTEHAKPSPTFPVLLIHNNNSTHICIEAMEHAEKHGVILVTLPPHVPLPDRTSLNI